MISKMTMRSVIIRKEVMEKSVLRLTSVMWLKNEKAEVDRDCKVELKVTLDN